MYEATLNLEVEKEPSERDYTYSRERFTKGNSDVVLKINAFLCLTVQVDLTSLTTIMAG